MEDGSGGPLSNFQVSEHIENGIVSPIMANFPEGTVTEAKDNKQSVEPPKVNGENNQDQQDNPFQDSYSSESDALVIDESVPKKKRVRGKYIKKSKDIVRRTSEKENDSDLSNHSDSKEKVNNDKNLQIGQTKDIFNDTVSNRIVQNNELNTFTSIISSENTQTSDIFSANNDNIECRISETQSHCDVPQLTSDISSAQELQHSNPFFNESLFELSQLHQTHYEAPNISEPQNSKESSSACNRTLKRVKPKPKIQEYAQYLGLQPAVQFKCPKCGKSGFESLVTLQEHFLQCNSVQSLEKITENENISGFKLKRKVFLCSTCGTYYENWNLYVHMLEYHKRYICLYCLGMFSILEDLCQHIQSRHNLEPGIKNTLEDFYNTYNEPCYVVCCECNRQFNEGDNFFYHNCVPTKSTTKSKPKQIKQIIAPENHVTGDFIAPQPEILNKPEQTAQSQKSDIERTYSKEDIEETLNNPPLATKDLPEKEQDSISNQVDSDKQNFNETQKSNEYFSDSSENGDDSVPKEKTININDNSISVDPKPSDSSSDKDNMEGTCEQDSLDSTKISDINLENLASTENTMDSTGDNLSDSREIDELIEEPKEEPVETRKVPKLSLKLPKPGSYPEPDPEDSDDSEKLGMEVDNIESENENEHALSDTEQTEEQHEQEESVLEQKEDTPPPEPRFPEAGIDIPIIEIELDQPLDKMDVRVLLQKCLHATVPTCIYCNHSRRISVNGKQLALHAMAEHRYSAINKSITEEELSPDSFNLRMSECLEQLETVFFNLDSDVSEEAVTFSHVFECFQCHYSTTVHKELYLHNRKFHSKNLLLCIMCKSNFYSYSELICHLCPGVYILDYDLQFRCCMCVSNILPSSFRLMVHLRKRHNVCDVCLEMCHSQYKLSNHVWKHKLHHFCYRCGIAYRNKPDITRHLFWKHGTESVLCTKCLQKKWPHVYHFCVPPTSFTCEDCNLVLTKAVSLKVHKRLHAEEKKHSCTWEDCTEAFISKKLMLKHLKRHTDPQEEVKEEIKEEVENKENEATEADKEKEEAKEPGEPSKPVKPKVDVYDLPELNLSESDTSDSETESEKPKIEENLTGQEPEEVQQEKQEGGGISELQENIPADQNTGMSQEQQVCDVSQQPIVDDASSSVMQDIWDNFKNYQANKEKLDNMLIGEVEAKVDQPYIPDIPIPVVEEGVTWQMALRDHDYCTDPENMQASGTIIEVKPSLESTESIDHDYCFQTEKEKIEPVVAVPPPQESPADEDGKKSPPRKRSSSSSSSSSGSDSSCACGSDCSCSDSSSGSSSSSSDSSNSDSSTEEGRKKQQQRRLKRKEKSKVEKKQRTKTESETKVDVVTSEQPAIVAETPIRESDLETTESETDEEFYDRDPLKFAKKILEEKRALLVAEMGPNMVPNGSFIESTSRPPTPPAGTVEEEDQRKKKKKTKKRKKRKSEKKEPSENRTYSATLIMDTEPIVPPPPPAIPYYQQFHQTLERQYSPTVAPITLSLARNSPVQAPHTPPLFTPTESHSLARQESTASDSSVRASKRRRVPNKFYGYSSDEEADKPQSLKRSKVENNRTIPAPASPMLVPPITIKTVPTPTAMPPRPPMVEPITLRLPRPLHPPHDFKSNRKPVVPPIRLAPPRLPLSTSRDDSATESNDSDNDEPVAPPPIVEPPKPPQPQLYCYCRCPYDEVSEMIGCDSSDCQIEWFHFECVGIMVPPKGQWFCPDCRKRKQQQRRDMLA